jgi:hypothetical protein
VGNFSEGASLQGGLKLSFGFAELAKTMYSAQVCNLPLLGSGALSLFLWLRRARKVVPSAVAN